MSTATDSGVRGRRRGWREAGLSLGAALLVLLLKAVAYLLTGSVSLFSDAAESLVNVVAAIALLTALRLAGAPPDYRHPYGHQKAEYLSSALEAAMILLAAAMISLSAIQRLLDPRPLDNVPAGIIVAVAAAVINALVAWRLQRAAKQMESPALAANATHLLTDVWTSAGVVAAVTLVAVTGWWVLDPVIALLVAAWIARQGVRVLGEAVSSLLDARLPEAEESSILDVLDAYPGVHGYHRLRSRRSGSARFAEVDVFVDPELSVREAHDLVAGLEAALRERLPDLQTTIHVEPIEPGLREGATRPRDEFPPS